MPDKTQKQMIIEMYGTLQRLDERTEAQAEHQKKADDEDTKRDKRLTKLEITVACLITSLVSAGVLEKVGVISIFG